MKIALVLLTYNRLDFVKRAVSHNFKNSGYTISEIIWVDNNSTDGTREFMEKWLEDMGTKYKKVLHSENLGVAKGYNSAYELLDDEIDFVARPGTDMLMPDDWLRIMVEFAVTIRDTGIIGMISEGYKDHLEKRALGPEKIVNGKKIRPAKTLGSILFNAKIIKDKIFLPTDQGLYGFSDSKWDKKVRDASYLNYYIDGIVKDFIKEELEKYPNYVNWKHDQVMAYQEQHPDIPLDI